MPKSRCTIESATKGRPRPDPPRGGRAAPAWVNSLVTRFDQIEHACLTDVGVRRSHNQDSYAVQLVGDAEGWQQRGHLFLVADGMGAHAVGEKASEQAAHVIPHIYQKHAQQGTATAIRRSFG